ncbi:pleckstrin homology domain-containing family H member 1-like isoform X1 [Dreissena polymorpha]|uniref:pleckstrin homology domain-containing family H member 1-like isoform X1 n=1 Tax=Dreissena polymorpha TaxID=45954 RepID=UPI002264ACA0|nr:pleckstrin homology domain-containing family H member 1-like isoform X1 [Dreissena polymorpha]XP_052276495.1 pleckstrin homology domain-containing family H member 1-like isoform X1 [Dreissena polymorpha]
MAEEPGEVIWKQKYEEQQGSLEKFRKLAGKIKETLKAEMKDLERRKIEAEFRANVAEEKLRVMEQQLAAVNWQPDDFERHIRDLERQCRDKDRRVVELQLQFEEQRVLRQEDAKVVEEKAARIKDWVSGKLSQLEMANHELRLKNEMLSDQVETLRERLQALPVSEAKHIHKISSQEHSGPQTASQEYATATRAQRSKPQSRLDQSDYSNISASQGTNVTDNEVDKNDYCDDTNLELTNGNSRPESDLSTSFSYTRLKGMWSRPVSSVTGSRPESEIQSSRPESQSTYSRPHKRPSSSIIEALEIENELFNYGLDPGQRISDIDRESPLFDLGDTVSENGSNVSMGEIEMDPLYQEVDQNHESVYEPKKPAPPQIRIERKIFQERMDSFVSSSNDSEDMLERINHRPIYATSDKPMMQVEPMSRSFHFEPQAHSSQCMLDDEVFSMGQTSPVTITSLSPHSPRSPATVRSQRTPHSSLTSHSSPASIPHSVLPTTPQLPDLISSPTSNDHKHQPRLSPCFFKTSSSNTFSSNATLPRRPIDRSKTQPVHFNFEESVIAPSRSDGQVVSAEIHSAPATVSRQASRKDTSPKASRARLNTWSSKAYPNVPRERKTKEASFSDHCSAKDLYKDVSVPVFATLKGKARQIRNTPFTEESAESSEDEGTSDPEGGAPATPRTIARRLNTTSTGATKRGGCTRQSNGSEVSGDYASPPDNVTVSSDSDTTEPEQKLVKYEENKHDTLDKCGYLSKLGGKVKTWKKRWCVLRGSELYYYKSQHDMLKKPQGCIKLDDQTKISRTHGELTFEITNSKRTIYLSADTFTETDRWVRVLQKVLKRQANSYLLDQVETKAVIKGYLTKVKNGVTKKCWCVLLGGYFLYYKSSSSKTPYGQIDLQGARLEEISTPSESDEEAEVAVATKHVMAIWPPYQGPTYLIVPTKLEKDSWLYHLTVAAGGGTGNVGTHLEQLIAKLMQVEGDQNSVYWKHPVLLHSKEPVSGPLTTLPSKHLQKQALELCQEVHQFMCTLIDSQSLAVHVNLAQSILHQCIQQPQLQNELFCQLIKQTSRHPVQTRSTVQNLLLCGKQSWYLCHTTPTSPSNSILDLTAESKMNPPSYVIVQGWQLLAMCVSLFLPKQSVMWLLKMHLHRNADHRTDTGKYAIFCQRALTRSQQNGLREVKPSRMEVMSILLRHPYHHSQPLSIPVHFLNHSYQVISFDGSTTIQEFLQAINKSLGVQDCAYSGFALYSDDPIIADVETCLQNHVKICDVISKWEECFREFHGGKSETSRSIKLLYKNRLYYKSTSRFETDREKLLLTYQINEEIVCSRFPLNRDLALELASLMGQIEYGDLKASDAGLNHHVSQVLERFYPKKYKDALDEGLRKLQDRLVERWSSLRGRSQQDCVRVYLAVAHKWQFCGAKLFLTRERETTSPDDVWLAVQEEGVAVLEYSTMQPIHQYDFRSVVTFGGWNDDLMIVVNQLLESAPHHYEHRTQKLLFILAKHKILEATHLIASYINSRVQRQSQEPNGGLV